MAVLSSPSMRINFPVLVEYLTPNHCIGSRYITAYELKLLLLHPVFEIQG